MSTRVSRPHSGQGCEQVAAVCYQISSRGIEFLLVRTRGRRWTFPKGGIEPGLTHAQAAALEAVEEAGVHGRMEETPFVRYLHSKRGGKEWLASGSSCRILLVQAHLCEVLRLGRLQERGRDRTWFSGEKAKRRLREGRAPHEAAELARVVDRALSRVQRLKSSAVTLASASPKDALQRVQFEAFGAEAVYRGTEGPSFTRYLQRQGNRTPRSAEIEFAINAYLCKVPQRKALGRTVSEQGKVLQLGPPREIER